MTVSFPRVSQFSLDFGRIGGFKDWRGAGEGVRVPIEETEIFRIFEECADWAWRAVEPWPWEAKKTVGIQLIRAVDSINANLVEGDGRYTSADGLHFFVIARASAREARLWIRRAISRGLVLADDGEPQICKLDSAAKQLNLLISHRRRLKGTLTVREEIAQYAPDLPPPPL